MSGFALMDMFRDKVAVITGAASGIGRALAEALARRGAKLVLLDIDGSRLDEASKSIQSAGAIAENAELDVTNAAEFERIIAAVHERHGRIDYFFNNAGIGGAVSEAHNLTLEDWQRVLSVDMHGVVHGVLAVYPRMVRQGFGHIINTASAAGLVPQPMLVMYGAAKHAVVGLSQNLRIEAERYGVRVSAVCPGLIQTAIFERGTTFKQYSWAQLAPLLPTPLPAEACARAILSGVERNRPIIVVTKEAWVMWLIHRISVRCALWLAGLVTRRAMSSLEQEARDSVKNPS
jgi:NADP-dependent 3-hydroxy acid dehydrogenase YdfG